MESVAIETDQISEETLWYCVKARPRHELTAKASLVSTVGVEVFCPMMKFERARRNGRMRVIEAMFPGYLFARFSYAAQHRQIATTTGISTILKFGGLPAVVAPSIIGDLRALVAADETVEIPSEFQPGTEVQVVEGPLRGMRSVVTRVLPGRARVAILLEMLGMTREIEVEERLLLPEQRHPLATAH